MARPRKQLDQAKLAYAHREWHAGRMSLLRASKLVGCGRDQLRMRWPEFAVWSVEKRRRERERHYVYRQECKHGPDPLLDALRAKREPMPVSLGS